jgi:hypothetical protein
MYEDTELRFDLGAHVEGIGMTGWDWLNKQSLWVGFDFDSITNHEKTGLSNEELNKIRDIMYNIPYVTIVKSTSGKGLHIYVHLEPGFITATHTEHAALARSILTLLSMETGYNLQSSVDVCGGVLWVYHRKQEGTDGLSLIKSAVKLTHNKIPKNWKEHINVTSGKTKRISINFDDSTVKYIKLDEEHRKLLQWFRSAKLDNWWDSDHNMLVCHTFDLRDAHKELGLKGMFFTNSSGSSSQNCFAFPLPGGAWVIRRHGHNVKEHESWSFDGMWTRCLYNAALDFDTISRIFEGIENSHGEYVFKTLESGLESLVKLGVNIDPAALQDNIKARQAAIKEKGDKLIISIDKEKYDTEAPKGFVQSRKGNKWERVVSYIKPKKEVAAPDNLIRHVISGGADAGWYINVNGTWILHNKSNAITVLLGETDTFKHFDIEVMMSQSILNPWELVNIPFAEEYPGDRKWNKDAACLIDTADGEFPTWLDLFNHVGKNLNSSVLNDYWCIENAVKTGGEYLLLWFANALQRPYEPLPYLFFVGEQNTGKSTLHEAFGQFIIKRGYVRADNALINPQGFNAEIANAVVCVVEETDLRRNKDAANRLKDWVTGKTIQINQKYKTPYDMGNTSHWIQCANDALNCLVLPGDTRINVIEVDKPEKEIPKEALFTKLKAEAGAFLGYLVNLELPTPPGRLAIPCIATHEKDEIQSTNMSELELFIKNECTACQGNRIELTEFYNKFSMYVSEPWTVMKMSRAFPKSVVKGKYGLENKVYIANLKFVNDEIDSQDFVWKLNHANGRLEK